MNNLDKIASHFDLAGEIAEIKPCGSGHIHETFHIRTLPDTVDD